VVCGGPDERSVKILEDKFGREHRCVVPVLINLGVFYQKTCRFAEAEQLMLRTLRISESSLGQKHLYVAISLDNLASLYRDLERFDDAEKLFDRALNTYRFLFGVGNGHPLVSKCQRNMSAVLHIKGQSGKALALQEAAMNTDQALQSGIIMNSSERDMFAHLETTKSNLWAFTSMAFTDEKTGPMPGSGSIPTPRILPKRNTAPLPRPCTSWSSPRSRRTLPKRSSSINGSWIGMPRIPEPRRICDFLGFYSAA
jgi:tetratricopeptide (TPR) repeat protein